VARQEEEYVDEKNKQMLLGAKLDVVTSLYRKSREPRKSSSEMVRSCRTPPTN
jgi:hypothetical protein